MTLLGIKIVGFVGLALALLTSIVVQWLRRPIQSLKEGEEVREFVEVGIFGVLVYVLPGLAERWYGINWWLAAAVTVAVLAPLIKRPRPRWLRRRAAPARLRPDSAGGRRLQVSPPPGTPSDLARLSVCSRLTDVAS